MIRTGIAALACGLLAFQAQASTYPDRPVRVVVPFTPGGGTDLVARMISQKLTERNGRNFVVDNRPAVDGIVGTEIVAKSPADGYTLILVSSSHAINVALGRKLPYDTLKDFAPIAHTANQQLILVSHPSVAAKSVRELVALAKSAPGSLNYGSSSNASALPMELFKAMTDTKIQHIPYKGSGPMLTDLIGGQIQLSIAPALAAIPHARSGKLRPLGMAGPKRSPAMPDLPTIAEAGVAGYQALIWTGMLAPAKTPDSIITKLNRDIVEIVQAAEFREKLLTSGAEAVGSTPAAWGSFLRDETTKWQKIARFAGLVEK